MAKKRKLTPKSGPSASAAEEETPTLEESTLTAAAATEETLNEGETLYEEETYEDEEEDDEAPDQTENPSPADAGIGGGDAEPGDIEPEPVEKLLEPFTKEQLIELLKEAAEAHPDVMDRVTQSAESDPVHRKIFVHGLGWDTTAETLAEAFRGYGEIEDCNAVRDKVSGKSKGYGFILFKTRVGARRALLEPQKKIGNRMTACQLASAGPAPTQPPALPVSEHTQKKIYVSNVSADLDPQKLLQFFSKYGEIEEGPLGMDKQTGKPKGFALFVYKSVESARKALEEPHKSFDGHILHCQKAIDGPKPNKVVGMFPHQNPRPAHFPRSDNTSFAGGPGPAHMVGQSSAVAGGMGYNPAAAGPGAVAGFNPAIGQAITALLAAQGTGLGLTNLLGTAGAGSVVNPGGAQMVNNGQHMMQGGYANPAANPAMMGGYGNQPAMQGGGYGNPQMGQGSGGRGQTGYMGGYTGH
ncbi:Heterogeneous nuclear ribonucleoprotein 1 [Acorus calamus]|uniref:Heterogeneous nuclear ribonucleoprotein 1 n=1 Tax=Acorus calamus TaxID=4465 RepID=A0AAV9EXU9_ACOCL|nr:Heterogeneous nuclear ribonucleoprotein 1 [Acorus calamus]